MPTVPQISRRGEDLLRSIKRYAAVALGDQWEVRLSREEGAFLRPFARVTDAGPPVMRADNQFLASIVQPFAIYAYPPALDTPDTAAEQAEAVEETLLTAFMIGVAGGKPMRMPIYNYQGVALNQPGVWLPPDYARVTDFNTQKQVDADDNRLWTVIASVRLAWRRTLGPISTGPPLTSVGPIDHEPH